MKALSTIQKMKRLMYKMAQDPKTSDKVKDGAYSMAVALQWATENTSWNPATILREINED